MKASLLIPVTFLLGACTAKPVPLLESIGSTTLPPTTEATSLPRPEEAAGIALKATTDGILSGLIRPDHWEDPTYRDKFDDLDHTTPCHTGESAVSKRTLSRLLARDDCKGCKFYYGIDDLPPPGLRHGIQRSQPYCPSHCRSDEKSKEDEKNWEYLKELYGLSRRDKNRHGKRDRLVSEPFFDDILRFAVNDYSHMSLSEFRKEILRQEQEEQKREEERLAAWLLLDKHHKHHKGQKHHKDHKHHKHHKHHKDHEDQEDHKIHHPDSEYPYQPRVPWQPQNGKFGKDHSEGHPDKPCTNEKDGHCWQAKQSCSYMTKGGNCWLWAPEGHRAWKKLTDAERKSAINYPNSRDMICTQIQDGTHCIRWVPMGENGIMMNPLSDTVGQLYKNFGADIRAQRQREAKGKE